MEETSTNRRQTSEFWLWLATVATSQKEATHYTMDFRNNPRLKGAIQGHPKALAGARPGTPSLRCKSSPGSFQGHFSTDLPQGKDKTQLVSFIQGPKRGVKSGTARITRWRPREQGGAGSRRPHLAVPLRGLQGCGSRTAPRRPPPGVRGAHGARPRRPVSAPQSRVRTAPSVRRGRRGHFV